MGLVVGAVSPTVREKWVSGPPAAGSVGGTRSANTYQEATLLDGGDVDEPKKERSGSPGSCSMSKGREGGHSGVFGELCTV